jgi:hypothetical protein
MLETIGAGLAAWRQLLHLSEWTGLSLGALAGLGALAWYVAPMRKLAIVGGLAVAAGWAGLVHGDAVGRADLQKQWDAAKLAAAAAARQRDAAAAQDLEAKYQPIIAGLQQQADDRDNQVKDYERKMLELLAATPASGSCRLGAAALRLRNGR